MSRKLFPVLLGMFLVALVRAAPVANQEQAVGLAQADDTVNKARDKRAEEEIVFGNQQNENRVMSKKSDLSNVIEVTEDSAPGEVDQGSEVIVHKEIPVEEDLAERADEARKDFDDQAKMSDALEAAMDTVHTAAAAKQEEQVEGVGQAQSQAPSTELEQGAATPDVQATYVEDDAAAEEVVPPAESGKSETDISSDVEGSNDNSVAVESGSDEDEDIKDLLQATRVGQDEGMGAVTADQMTGGVSEAAASREDATQPDQEQDVTSDPSPAEVQGSNDAENQQRLADYYRDMYQYMVNAYQGNARSPSKAPYDFFRRRRSLAGSRQGAGRRIKRDLLDDAMYDPAYARYLYGDAEDDGIEDREGRYRASSSVIDMNDALITDPDDYVPLTEDDAKDLYRELEDYLEWELERREGAQRLKEILGLESAELDGGGEAEEAGDQGLDGYYGGDPEDLREEAAEEEAEEEEEEEEEAAEMAAERAAERAYMERENPLYAVRYPSDDPYDYVTAKRGSDSDRDDFRFPAVATRKRYFFPFSDEPETHWGAFVPEKRARTSERSTYLDDWREPEYRSLSKRDYNEAIYRLQRLAMALSDNRGPYFNEIVQEQPYKK